MNPIAKLLISTPVEQEESEASPELEGMFDEPEDDSYREGEEAITEELLDAFHTKNVHAFRTALKSFIQLVRNSER